MFAYPLQAQQPPVFNFKRITIKDGLSNDVVSCMFKDSRGFIWFGTADGLNRYDGKNFKIYRHNKKDKYSIPGNAIIKIDEDKKGRLWIQAYNTAIACMDIHNEKFTNYYHSETDTNSIQYGSLLLLSNTSTVYAYTNDKVQWLDEASGKFHSIAPLNDGLNLKPVRPFNNGTGYLAKLSDGSIWGYGLNGIFLLNETEKKFHRFYPAMLHDGNDLFKDHTGRYWYGEWDAGLSELIINEKKLKNYIPNNRIGSITEYKDVNGKYWILASDFKTGNIIALDPETGNYHLQPFKPENETIPNTWPGPIYIDNENKVWVLSSNGIFVSSPTEQAFKKIWLYDRTKPFDAFYNGLVRHIFKTGNLYAAGVLNHGVHFFDSNFIEKNFIQYITDAAEKKINWDVRSSTLLPDGNFILGGGNGAMLWKPYKNPVFISKPIVINDIDINNYWRDMLPIDDDTYWVRFNINFIWQFDIRKNIFIKKYQIGDLDKSQIGIQQIVYDSNHTLWVATGIGLYYFDAAKDAFIKQPLPANEKENEFANNVINHINTADKGFLWLSTNNGLLKYQLNNRQVTSYNQDNGFTSNILFKSVFDHSGRLWINLNFGIAVIDTTTKKIINYNSLDGLPVGTNQPEGAFFLTDKDELLQGNQGVLTIINTRLLHTEKDPPKVIIMNVEGRDSLLYFKKNSTGIPEVTVNFTDFPVNILFNITDYTANAIRKYYYKTDDSDTSWLPLKDGVYTLNNMAPGKHKIYLTGSINDIWPALPQCIILHVIPAWYQSVWFKTLCAILITLLSIAFFRWRINMAKKSERQQTEIQTLKTEELQKQLEQEQIANYFSTSIQHISTVDEVLWDVARNLIGKLGFEDCTIYLWNDDKTRMVQRAGYGPKGSIDELEKEVSDMVEGQGVVGYVMQHKEPVIINDTSKDSRYRNDEMNRLSEICVPMIHNDHLAGIIDSEHHQKNYFTTKHLQTLTNIATLTVSKINAIEAEMLLQKKQQELMITSQQLETAKLDALRSQMNPHFIFNSLNSIENFVLKNDRFKASQYLTKFSRLIRLILDHSNQNTILISSEMDLLKLYIEMESLRFENKFEYEISTDDIVRADTSEIPSMLIQPYIENAIWHGLLHKEAKGKLLLRFKMISTNRLQVIIEDNGIGRQKAMELRSKQVLKKKSYGMQIAADRIDIINRMQQMNASVVVEDLIDNTGYATGTKVIIEIPLQPLMA